jgi:hypothetical protein
VCPNCGTANDPGALFCEACGYDFTTGTLPRPAETPTTSELDLDAPLPAAAPEPAPTPAPDPSAQPAAQASAEPDASVTPVSAPSVAPSIAPSIAVEWVVELWVDPDWYAAQEAEDPCPSPGLPEIVPLRRQSVLVGRPSASRNIHPDIDCTGDPGVSRRQAQLTTDGQRWWIEDLQSSNGTYVGPASGPLPTEALQPGQRRELDEDDRIYIGAWTRLVVRPATPEEQQG